MKTVGSNAPGIERRDWAIRLGVAAMTSMIAAVLGPFSTYDHFSFLDRLLYWGGLIMGLVFPAFFVRTVVYRFFPGVPLLKDLISAGAVSVSVGPLVWAFNRYFMDFAVNTPVIFLEHIGIIALVCLVPVSIRAYMRMSFIEIQAQSAPNVVQLPVMTEAQTAFVRRLEPDKRGYVLRVSADDHQVDVWTDQGGSKLRLRFGDALEELLEFDGTRIHRSHWVAFNTIESVVPDGRRHKVFLKCGAQLPVSLNGLRALKDADICVQDRSEAS